MIADAFRARVERPATVADGLHDVRAFVHRYVHLTAEQGTIVATWVLMTHAIAAFDFTAYLHITSPLPECGKTRLLEVLESLVASPWLTARVSAAVLMRKIDKEHPTLLLDESDAAFKGGDEQYTEALRGMLNAGFHRSGKASVCVGQGANLQYRDFSVFGPKAISGIGRLPATVESRAIPIIMKRKMTGEIVHKWRRRDAWADADDLRPRLAATLAPHIETLKAAVPACPAGLSDRAEDVVEPLLAVADVAGGEWPQAVRAAAVALMGASRVAREADQNIALQLLSDLREIFAAHQQKAAFSTTKIILPSLIALEDRPWAAFGRNEKPLTAVRFAKLVSLFGIAPAGTIRDGAETFKGYRREGFEDAFARYLASEPSHGHNSNESGPETPKTEPSHDPDVTAPKTAVDPDKHWSCDGVTAGTPDHGGKGDVEPF